MAKKSDGANTHCAVCGKKITDNHRWLYCSDACGEIGYAPAKRLHNDKLAKDRSGKRAAKRKRIDGNVAALPDGNRKVDKRFSHYCEKYKLLMSKKDCEKRQRGASFSKGNNIDYYCDSICHGSELRASTDEEVYQHLQMVKDLADAGKYSMEAGIDVLRGKSKSIRRNNCN